MVFLIKLGIMEKKRKRKAILLLAYIADVSCLINRSFKNANIVFKYLVTRFELSKSKETGPRI